MAEIGYDDDGTRMHTFRDCIHACTHSVIAYACLCPQHALIEDSDLGANSAKFLSLALVLLLSSCTFVLSIVSFFLPSVTGALHILLRLL